MNFSDDELEELEEQYKDIDPKLIQIQILMELSQIRMALTTQSESETTVYECKACGESVESSKLKSHAERQHNAPKGMDVEDLDLYSING